MNRLRILVLAAALAAAVLAAYLAQGMLAGKQTATAPSSPSQPSAEVLVAGKAIATGEKLAGFALEWRVWPRGNVAPQMITREARPNAITELESYRARQPLISGEPIADAKILGPDSARFMSGNLPQGLRAIAIAVSELTGVSGFILPDDRVDVILTRKLTIPGRTEPVSVSQSVLTNVRVLAINQTFATGGDATTVTEGKQAVLELEPRQAELVKSAENTGTLSLALRSMAEAGDAGQRGARPEFGPVLRLGTRKEAKSGPLIIRYGVEAPVTPSP